MGKINFGRLALWVPSPDWLWRILEECGVCQAHRWSRRTLGGSAGRAPTSHRIPCHLPYKWRKLRKSSVRITEWRPAVQRRTRFVLSTWTSRRWPRLDCCHCLPCLSLQATGSNLGQLKFLPSCRTRGFPHLVTLSRNSRSGLWCGRQRAERSDPRVCACYLRNKWNQ